MTISKRIPVAAGGRSPVAARRAGLHGLHGLHTMAGRLSRKSGARFGPAAGGRGPSSFFLAASLAVVVG